MQGNTGDINGNVRLVSGMRGGEKKENGGGGELNCDIL
jgi:hypothetical protein